MSVNYSRQRINHHLDLTFSHLNNFPICSRWSQARNYSEIWIMTSQKPFETHLRGRCIWRASRLGALSILNSRSFTSAPHSTIREAASVEQPASYFTFKSFEGFSHLNLYPLWELIISASCAQIIAFRRIWQSLF